MVLAIDSDLGLFFQPSSDIIERKLMGYSFFYHCVLPCGMGEEEYVEVEGVLLDLFHVCVLLIVLIMILYIDSYLRSICVYSYLIS